MEPSRIKALRKAMNLTMEAFATKLKSSFTTVCHWESGRFSPNLKNLRKLEELCKEYGIETICTGTNADSGALLSSMHACDDQPKIDLELSKASD